MKSETATSEIPQVELPPVREQPGEAVLEPSEREQALMMLDAAGNYLEDGHWIKQAWGRSASGLRRTYDEMEIGRAVKSGKLDMDVCALGALIYVRHRDGYSANVHTRARQYLHYTLSKKILGGAGLVSIANYNDASANSQRIIALFRRAVADRRPRD